MDLVLDLATAAVRRLKGSPVIAELIQDGYLGTDAASGASLSDKVKGSWIFQGINDDLRPYRDPENSGTAAIALQSRSDWAKNDHNTAGFPQLRVYVYVDSTRRADGSAKQLDADRKARHVARALDSVFHLPGHRQEDQLWGGLYVHSSLREGNLSIQDVPGTQGAMVRLDLTYNATTD